MMGELEHVNFLAKDLDETVKFLTAALPHFRVRGRGGDGNGNEWLHIGTETSYLAVNSRPEYVPARLTERLAHIGFVVDDVEGIRERLSSAGYREGTRAPDHPYRKRLYFLDAEGHEWEFVEYLTNDPAERNDYSS